MKSLSHLAPPVAPLHPLQRKLAILADAAKYDASCASSDAPKRDSLDGRGLGATNGAGICHSWTPDGRCVSLLKILLTNYCQYDCLYCVNRVSSNVPRARFSVAEVVQLTLDFYRRNCIEGLFLSSGIIQSPDYTMEQLVGVARTLREGHDFRGYIHLKTIPDASAELLAQAGRYADRLSINIELPSRTSLALLAPQKNSESIAASMGIVHRLQRDNVAERRQIRLGAKAASALAHTADAPWQPSEGTAAPMPVVMSRANAPVRRALPPRFAPSGQSTQMIVGADASTDTDIITLSAALYERFALKRVYYSAFSPIPDAARALPLIAPPLRREHRLYQADWLMRYYGFAPHEVVADAGGMLDLEVDPKLAWALAHRQWFPVRLQTAPKDLLLRVPGLGVRSVLKLLKARRGAQLRLQHLAQLHVPLGKVLPFVEVADHHPGPQLDAADLRQRLLAQAHAPAAGASPGYHAGSATPQLALF